jgi:hypothetical protein
MDPSQSDFANYFTPAFVLGRGGDLGALYDRDAFAAALAQSGLTGLGSFVPHPPANALWLLPLASLPPFAAKGLWSGILIASLIFTIRALSGLRSGFALSTAVVLVMAPTLAVRNGLAFGQPYVILAALLAGGALALEQERDLAAGFLLGLGVSFKPYALGIGVLFLHGERRRALAGFAAGAILPSLLLWALAGPGPFIEFASKVLPWMLKADIQDPFSPVWGSASALANRLFRFEPDLNPHPWLAAPILARFSWSAVSSTLLALGVLSGRRALDSGKPLDGVGISTAFALAASPFTASYHLVLLTIPMAAVAARHSGGGAAMALLGFAALGSPAVNLFHSATGILAPLAYMRFFLVAAVALVVSGPFVNRRMIGLAALGGVLVGALAVPRWRGEEAWPRIESARGYSMMKPYFCGSNLRWMSPSADGHGLESRGDGPECAPTGATRAASPRGDVVSRFTDGSWDLYLRAAPPSVSETRLTFSPANEIDPALTPDGCAVVFASDQGRGLGSTALYRLDLSSLMEGCGGSAPGADRR